MKSDVATATGGSALDDHDLVLEFESLGGGVELGCVQRACGAEPLSLFRFTACRIASICHALETRLDHLFTQDDLEAHDLADGRFSCRSRYYNDFFYYVYSTTRQLSVEEVTIQERRKIGYLHRRILADLKISGKIFVRTGSEALGDLRRLHRALAAYGPHVLLLVGVADVDHPAGTVEQLEEGLLRGFVSEFKVCNRPEPFDVASWLAVLQAAHRMTRPKVSYTRPRRLEAGSTWTFAEHCEVGKAPSASAAARVRGQTAYQVTKNWSARAIEVIASHEASTVDLAAHAVIVFSAWVRVPAGFAGRRLFISFEGLPSKHEHPVDLRRLNHWQRIWATTRVPRETRSLTASVCVEGMLGTPMCLGGWTFEDGCAPSIEPPGLGERVAGLRARSRRSALLRRLRRASNIGDATSASLCRRAALLIANGAFVEADDLLSDGMSAFPNDAALAKMYALSAHNSARYFGAVDRWNHALSLNTDDPMCFAGFAANLREYLSMDRATDVIGAALSRFPDDMVVLTEAARIADATHRPADALKLWEKAIALHGDHPQWILARDKCRNAISAQAGRPA